MKFQLASGICSKRWNWLAPAMLPSTSSRPNAAVAAATAPKQSSRRVRSKRPPSIFPPAAAIASDVRARPASSMSAPNTSAPSLASRIAVARPIPDAAPVISATLPPKRPMPSPPACVWRRARAGWYRPRRRDGRLPPVQRRDLRRPVPDLQAAARRIATPLPRRVRLLVRVALRGRVGARAGPAQPHLEVRHHLDPPGHQADADLAEPLGPRSTAARPGALVFQPAVQARRRGRARAEGARVRARGYLRGA